MRLVDSHGHLNADRFADDVELVVGAARLAGVERILVPGWNAPSSERALALVDRFPWLDAAVGVHPHDAARATDGDWASIEAWARDERVLAVGETGLDSDRMFSPVGGAAREPPPQPRPRPRDGQAGDPPLPLDRRRARRAGRAARRAARGRLRRRGRARDAFGDRPAAVVHSFSGPVDYARDVIAMGLAVSFSGLVFRRGEEPSADVAAARAGGPAARRDRLAVPRRRPGTPRSRNEPAHVAVTAAWVAERRGTEEAGRRRRRAVACLRRDVPRAGQAGAERSRSRASAAPGRHRRSVLAAPGAIGDDPGARIDRPTAISGRRRGNGPARTAAAAMESPGPMGGRPPADRAPPGAIRS